MNRFLQLAALALLLTGCQEKIVTVPAEPSVAVPTAAVGTIQVPVSKLTDAQKIALLRAEAHKRGLRWHVYCVEDDHFKGFQAAARQKSEPPNAIYIEEGAKGYWIERGATQADAAYNLYLAIQDIPTFQPNHAPKTYDPKSCPGELRGD